MDDVRQNAARIRELNDRFRTTFTFGRVMITRLVDALRPEVKRELMRQVQEFSAWGPDNDPHGEHDFGAIDLDGYRYFWKIDYYGPTFDVGSEDPADPEKTTRVLTIMRASEY